MNNLSKFLITAVITGGLLVVGATVLANHSTSVSVTPLYVDGGSTDTYSFNVTNTGSDSIYKITVNIPTGSLFSINAASISCPLNWTKDASSDVSKAVCLTDPFDGSSLVSGGEVTISLDATSPVDVVDTLYTWNVTTKDVNAGFEFLNTTAQTTVDVVAPVTTDNAPDEEEWQISPFSINLTCDDNQTEGVTGSGCANTYYSLNEGEYVPGNIISINAEGVTDIDYYSEDVVGNEEAVNSISVKLDTAAPVTSDSADSEWHNAAVTVTLSTLSDTSGVTNTYYSSDGETNPIADPAYVYSGPFTLGLGAEEDGAYPLKYFSVDAAGNVEDLVTGDIVKIDKQAPTSSIIVDPATPNGNNPWYITAPTITLNCLDQEGLSRCKNTYYKWNAGDVYSTYGGSAITAPEGEKTLIYYSDDNAGNAETANTYSLKVDTIAPAVNAGVDKTTNASFTQDATVTDGGSGISTYVWTRVSGPGTLTFGSETAEDTTISASVDGTYVVRLTVTDAAGNSASDNMQLVWDTVAPSISLYTLDGSAANAYFNPTSDTVSIVLNASENVNWTSIKIENISDSGIYKIYQPRVDCDGKSQCLETWNGSLSGGVLADGEYKIKVNMVDLAGNQYDNYLVTNNIFVDRVSPTITNLTSPEDDEVYKAGGTLNLVFTPNDSLTAVSCSYTIGTAVTMFDCASGIGEIVEITGLNDGRQSLVLSVTDQAGNAASQTISFVYDVDDELTVGGTNPDFTTIQSAINAATVGDTISVSAGTYPESITIDKQLSLIGAGATTILSSAQNADGITVAADDVLIKDLKVITSNAGGEFDPANIAISVEEADNLEINGVMVETSGNKAMGIWIGGSNNGLDPVSGLTIVKSTINIGNSATGIYADHSTPAHSGWIIGGSLENANTVVATLGNPIELYDVSGSEVSYNTIITSATGGSAVIWSSELSNISNLEFSYNSVDYSGGSQVAFLTDFIDSTILGDILPNTTVSNVTVSENTFTNWGSRGLRIGSGVSSVVVNRNKFLHTGEAVKNESATQVNAEGNWWNTAVSANILTKLNGSIDYNPYYVNSVMTVLSSELVNTIYVDDNYADGLVNDNHIFGYDAFSTIQAGINAVADGGTGIVNVSAGTYTERLNINKNITLKGPQFGIDPNQTGVRTDLLQEALITEIGLSDPNPNILIEVVSGLDGVIIDGFTIKGDLTDTHAETSAIRIANNGSADNITVGNNIIEGRYNVLYEGGNNLTVSDNRIITNKNAITIQSGPATDAVISSNVITAGSNIVESDIAGIYLTSCTDCEVSNNTITNLVGVGTPYGEGIMGSNNINLTVSGNTITGMGLFGISFWGASSDNIIIRDNTVSGNGVSEPRNDAGGIIVKASNTTVENNQILNNGGDGIQVNDSVSGVIVRGNVITGNDNKGLNIISSLGQVGAELNWWGTTDGTLIPAMISGNADYRPWCTDPNCSSSDITAPTVSILSSAGTLTKNSPIPVTVTFSEAVSGFEIGDIIVGNGLAGEFVTSDYRIYTVNVTPTIDGEVTIDIAENMAWDLAGNYNTVATRYSVTYDSVVPVLSTVSIASDNANTLLSKVGDMVTLTITASESLQTLTAKINGADATVVSGSGTSWTSSRPMVSTDADGLITFTIDFSDLAGNTGTQVTAVTNTSSVTFDKAAPVVDLTAPTVNSKVNGDDLISFETNESSPECSVDNTNWTTCVSGTTKLSDIAQFAGLPQGAFTLYFKDTDAAGNSSSDSVSLEKDTIAPTVSSHLPASDAVNVDPDSSITVVFDEPVQVVKGDITFSPADVTSFDIALDSNSSTLTISNIETLRDNIRYTITLGATITDIAGNALTAESWSFTIVTTYNIPLYTAADGWNLISLPVNPADTAITAVLGSAASKINSVWTYDPENPATANTGGWLSYFPNDPENNLSDMTAGYGYWIKTTASGASLTGQGSLFRAGNSTPPSRTLRPGWNLVGFYQNAGTQSLTASNAFASLKNITGSKYWSSLWGYNNQTGVFTATADGTSVFPGAAFWISLRPDQTQYVYTPTND